MKFYGNYNAWWYHISYFIKIYKTTKPCIYENHRNVHLSTMDRSLIRTRQKPFLSARIPMKRTSVSNKKKAIFQHFIAGPRKRTGPRIFLIRSSPSVNMQGVKYDNKIRGTNAAQSLRGPLNIWCGSLRSYNAPFSSRIYFIGRAYYYFIESTASTFRVWCSRVFYLEKKRRLFIVIRLALSCIEGLRWKVIPFHEFSRFLQCRCSRLKYSISWWVCSGSCYSLFGIKY